MTKHFATPRPRSKANPPLRRPEISLRKSILRWGITLPLWRITTLSPPCVANSVRHRPHSIRFQHISPCTISNSSTTLSPRIAISRRPPAPWPNNLTAYAAVSQTLSTGRTAKRRGFLSMEAALGFLPIRRSSRFPRRGCRRYLNPDVDYAPIRQAIAAGQLKAEVIDDFLTPDALEQVRKFCLESTVWRHPYKFGYVGAFPQDGFATISLFAVAEELEAALGEAFDGYQLAQWWAFEYDARLPGTDIHGDDADFSLNLWITPDSANLDPDYGRPRRVGQDGAQ